VTVVDVCVVRASRIDLRWLAWFVNAPKFRMEVASLQSGSTRKRISRRNLATLSLPVPPLLEQHRIVAAIEQHLSRLEAGVAALGKVWKELARYRASVLKAACEGRLVQTEAALARAGGRSFEPASELLARILAERRTRWEAGDGKRRRRRAEPDQLDETGLPSIPEGWAWTQLSMVADLKGGITKGQRRGRAQTTRAVPYLRVANVQRGRIDLSEVKTIEASEAEIDELRLQKGDVLFNEGGDRDKLGRGWIWEEQIPECIHQNHVFRARLFSSAIHPKLVSFHGNTFGQAWFEAHGKQTTNLASINLTKLGQLPVPIAPEAEQYRIVAEVERRLSIADEVSATVESALARAARLRQSVLKRAFEGRLVPQDPSDEPASALLERIRAQRAQPAVPQRKRRRASS
jgi:type I restriction enzyme S subunit